jgi:hypothetical protein
VALVGEQLHHLPALRGRIQSGLRTHSPPRRTCRPAQGRRKSVASVKVGELPTQGKLHISAATIT